MKTFAIRDGDLRVEGGNYAMVEGSKKVFQDLSMAVGEPIGNDRFHPNWGTTLDRYIGGVFNAETELLVRTEIFRVVRNYVEAQQAAMTARSMRGQRSPYSSEEVVRGLGGVQIDQRFDRINVKITIQTGGTEPVVLEANVRP